MAVSACCLKGFEWEGTPTGSLVKLGANDAYKTGTNTHAAVMIIHDLFGWTLGNVRLLADHYAREADVTVYVPDFFGGESLPHDIIADGSRWHEIDIPAFGKRNSREIREPEIFACARALRTLGFAKVGAAGFCFGGWACFRLAGQTREDGGLLVDCVAMAHPSWATEADADGVRAPVLLMVPETDPMFTPALQEYTFRALRKRNVPFSYQHFPGVEHAFGLRGDPKVKGEREAMARAKRAAVQWFREFLHEEE